jgi:hypothetical protein
MGEMLSGKRGYDREHCLNELPVTSNISLSLTGRSSGSRIFLLAGLPRIFLQWLSRLSSPITAAGPLPNRRFRPTGFPINPYGT